MVKQRLISKRNEKNITQEDMAFRLGMNQSQYSRREVGAVKISKKEWDKIAKVLETSLEEIYEPEDGVYIINNENANGNFGNNNTYNAFSDFAVETMRKYIEHLEEENLRLKKELENK